MNALTRRDFLKAATAAAAGAALPGVGAESASTPLYPIGCYTRPWDQYDYRAALDGIAEAGFKYAGLMTAKGKSWVIITPSVTPEESARIGSEVTRRGMKTISVYGDFSVKESLEKGIADLRRLVDNCAAVGSPNLMLGGTGDAALYDNYVKVVSECCDYAVSKRVGLSVKPHGGRNATGPECRKMIERVGHKNFRLWYDPGNIFYYSDAALDPVDDCPSVADLVVGMSVKDFQKPKEVLVNPGDGMVDFKTVLAKLKAGGFRTGPLVIECLARGEAAQVTAFARKARLFLEQLTA